MSKRIAARTYRVPVPGYLIDSILYALGRYPDGMSAKFLTSELAEPFAVVLAALGRTERKKLVERSSAFGSARWHLRTEART
jgi:hypothetical protein